MVTREREELEVDSKKNGTDEIILIWKLQKRKWKPQKRK